MRILSAAVILLALPSLANAGFLAGFSGNSQFGPPPAAADAAVSFSVYENTDGDWTDDADFAAFTPASGPFFSGSIDATAKYVYLYQVINNNPTDPEKGLSLLLIPESSPGIYTSFGYIDHAVFEDADGGVGPATNVALGDDREPTGLPSDTPGDGVPSDFETPLGFLGDLGATNPRKGEILSDSVFFGASVASPINVLQFTFELLSGGYTTLLFATSNSAPKITRAEVQDGTPRSAGDIAVPTPEPGTLLLALAGLPVGLVKLMRRRRARHAATS